MIKAEDVFKYHDQMIKTVLSNDFYTKEFNQVKDRYRKMMGDMHMTHRDISHFWIDFWWKIPEDALDKDPYKMIKELAEGKYVPFSEYYKPKD